MKILQKIISYFKSLTFIQDLVLSFTPSFMFGALFYSNNSHLVHFDNSVLRFLSSLSLLFFIWILISKKAFFLKYLPIGFSFAFCFLVIFQQIPHKNIFIYVFSFLFAILIYYLRNYMKNIYIFYSCILLSQSLQGHFKYKKGTKINISKSFDLSIKKYNKPLKKSYSVYYLLVDNYSSFQSFKTIYQIDNSSFLNWLETKGFSVNQNAYSNYARTYTSMQATFQMKHNYYKNMNLYNLETPIAKYVMAGANPIMGRFYNSGFSVYINPYGLGKIKQISKWNGKVEKKIDLEFLKNDIYWFIMYYNDITSSDIRVFNLTSKSSNHGRQEHYIHKIKKINMKESPVFVYLHFHLNNNYKVCSGNNDRETLIRQIECVNQDLKKSIRYILKNDSNSIIILQADHGPDSISDNLIQRRFGILFSVRWPEKCKYLGQEKYTPINLFPRVFACINGEKPNYQNMAKDDSYLIGIWSDDKSKKPNEVFKVIENNEILPEFKNFIPKTQR